MSYSRLSALVEHLPVGILLLDSRGYIVYAGGMIQSILGYPHRELIGINVSRLMAASPAAMIHWYRTMIARRGLTLSMPLPMKPRQGAAKLLDCTLSNLLHLESVSGVLLTIGPVQDPISWG